MKFANITLLDRTEQAAMALVKDNKYIYNSTKICPLISK